MYATGTPYNLERRLHQLAATPEDYASYAAEALSVSLPELAAAKLSRALLKKADTLEIDPNVVVEIGDFLVQSGEVLLAEDLTQLTT